jgi:2-amino-4-hydroxy-6-hydroxymethyldihydropteridine diphosphokinase
MRYTIALGGNVGDARKTLDQAVCAIEKAISRPLAVSTYYWTKPLVHPSKPVRQNPYLNAVVEIDALLDPEEVLRRLLAIESSLGRVRANEQIPWGPRTIDLDLIAQEQAIVETEFLTLPHPQMHLRDFVLLPMQQVNPQWRHPLLKQNVSEMLAALQERFILSEANERQQLSGL